MGDYYKPGKKQNFGGRPTSQDVLKEQMVQMQQKKETSDNIKQLEKEEDKRYLQSFVDSLKYFDKNRNKAFLKFTNDFKSFNDGQILGKLTIAKHKNEEK